MKLETSKSFNESFSPQHFHIYIAICIITRWCYQLIFYHINKESFAQVLIYNKQSFYNVWLFSFACQPQEKWKIQDKLLKQNNSLLSCRKMQFLLKMMYARLPSFVVEWAWNLSPSFRNRDLQLVHWTVDNLLYWIRSTLWISRRQLHRWLFFLRQFWCSVLLKTVQIFLWIMENFWIFLSLGVCWKGKMSFTSVGT